MPRAWTRQPGDDDDTEVTVLGPAAHEPQQNASPEQVAAALAARKLDVALASTGASLSIVSLRPYQLEAIDAVAAQWSLGKRAPLIILPTGTGKTIVAAELMRRFVESNAGKRAVFTAHRKELLTQTVSKVKLVAPKVTVGLVQAKHNEVSRKITVASVQTLGHRSLARLGEVLRAGEVGLVVIDEAHHAPSPQYMRVIRAFQEAHPNVLFVGMTATPGREDGTGLDGAFDVIAYERNTMDMIRDGWLVPPVGIRVELDIDFDTVETKGGDFVESSLSKLMNQPAVNRAVVQAWGQHGQDRKMIVFACDVAHAHALAQEFEDHGFRAAAVDGEMKEKEREKRLAQFKTGEIKLLVNCQVLTEGFDESSCEGVLFARPTQSTALYIQMLGRGLRLHPGKSDCLVLDMVGNADRHPPVQLATLIGLDPLRPAIGDGGGQAFDEDAVDEEVDEEIEAAEITVDDMRTRDLDFHRLVRRQQLRYQWRETPAGWVLMVPRVGYLLVAFHQGDRTKATIRFHDTRKGRKHSAPQDITQGPVDFEMAYGLAEGFVERMFRANNAQSRWGKDAPPEEREAMPLSSLLDFDDEGIDPDIAEMAQRTMENDASWRERPPTNKQLELLRRLGVKEKDLPNTSGEAADIITILEVERDLRMRLPATPRQLGFLRANKIPFDSGLTKGEARKLIVGHRAKEARS